MTIEGYMNNPALNRHSLLRLATIALAAMSLLNIGGCALMRKDSAPLAQVQAEQIRAPRDVSLPVDAWPETQWWRRYGDDQLDVLVARAIDDSPTMAIARARVEAGRAKATLVDASTGVAVGLSASVDREHVSENGFLGPFASTNSALGTSGPWYTEGTIGLQGEYSVDLWGKDRAKVNAALGVLQARRAEAAEAELLLSSQVVHVYYDIQANYSVLTLLEQARDIQQQTVTAHHVRAARGLEPGTQAEGALTQQLQFDQKISATQTRIRSLREALRLLIGAGPDDLPVITARPLPDVIGDMPTSLGYELLARRPDLQAMHWYVQASLDQVDVAKAAFYPSFDIRAFIGVDALHMGDLFQQSSKQINLIPGLSLPIFDSGRLNANLASARSQSNVLIAQYNQAVLNAVREVAQAAIELNGINQQAAMQESELKAATSSFNSADAHYRQGLLDQSSATQAKLPVVMEEIRAVEIRSQRLHSEVTLMTYLGGGYEASAERQGLSTNHG
ncbi:MAG TPA: efflux transporter outer membrane subunit [Dyella sp.]|uniref:efflux transporter outer membrane subunit n=1 Tax=Dyella sp. TaxID=1869338 RepID=UPI002D76B322|nr:efflux transporter outer membrane subunit [Dyella sp.]HET6554199.1 efflux transporter outer membrane subunit [Dyella sp.]